MALSRLPIRDPRTVARDIPGVLDILFPRLSGGLVSSLNKRMFAFQGIESVSEELIEISQIQKAMIFEISVVRAESFLNGNPEPSWEDALQLASVRQRRHYDARVPKALGACDRKIADHAARNLVAMLNRVQADNPDVKLEVGPTVPGLGWIATGNCDFSLGRILIEVKHTDRNFVAGDFRQVLMYWLLKYAAAIENNGEFWSDLLLLNPRRNAALMINFEYLLKSASANSSRIELYELLRSIIGHDVDRR